MKARVASAPVEGHRGRWVPVGLALLLLWTTRLLPAQVMDAGVVEARGSRAVQDSVHVVRAGETLWSLAERYLGTGHAWKTLAERNGMSTASARPLLAVGQRLVIPPRPVRDVAAKPPVASPEVPGEPPMVGPSEPVPPDLQPIPLLSRRIGLVTDADRKAARATKELRTVFHRDVPSVDSAQAILNSLSLRSVPAPRLAEFEAAPLVMTARQFDGAVRLMGHATAGELASVHLGDLVEVGPPPQGMAVGARYVIGGDPVSIDRTGVLVAPVGVLQITRLVSKVTALAAVVRQSGPILAGTRLFPIIGTPAAPGRATVLERADIQTKVLWVDDEARIPTLQSYLVLGVGSSGGVRAGDEFAVYAASAGLELEVVRVRVVRTEPGTSAAIIVHQDATGVKRGMAARRIAKAP